MNSVKISAKKNVNRNVTLRRPYLHKTIRKIIHNRDMFLQLEKYPNNFDLSKQEKKILSNIVFCFFDVIKTLLNRLRTSHIYPENVAQRRSKKV